MQSYYVVVFLIISLRTYAMHNIRQVQTLQTAALNAIIQNSDRYRINDLKLLTEECFDLIIQRTTPDIFPHLPIQLTETQNNNNASLAQENIYRSFNFKVGVHDAHFFIYDLGNGQTVSLAGSVELGEFEPLYLEIHPQYNHRISSKKSSFTLLSQYDASSICAVAINADRASIAVGRKCGTVELHNLDTTNLSYKTHWTHDTSIDALAFKNYLLFSSDAQTMCIWNTQFPWVPVLMLMHTHESIYKIPAHTSLLRVPFNFTSAELELDKNIFLPWKFLLYDLTYDQKKCLLHHVLLTKKIKAGRLSKREQETNILSLIDLITTCSFEKTIDIALKKEIVRMVNHQIPTSSTFIDYFIRPFNVIRSYFEH